MNKHVQQIVDTIAPNTPHIAKDFYDLCEHFDIYECLHDKDINERITYQIYHSWICTDTEVGIKIWYFNDTICAMSIKWYRKYEQSFYWKSRSKFKAVKTYLDSLRDEEMEFFTSWDEIDSDLVQTANEIDYKKCEVKNYKTS